MDPSNAQHQAMANHTLEDILAFPKQQQERRLRPQPEQSLKCPRCDSTNTKFCYYNNYSLSQPRYFCKGCRRYWTKGGTLRNVPVGGGCRKNKRSSSSKRTQDQVPLSTNPNPLSTLPPLNYDSNDLTLAFARLQKQPSGQFGFDDHDHNSILGNPNTTHNNILGTPNTTNTTTPGFLDALRSGFLDTQNGFHNPYYYGFNNGNPRDIETIASGGYEEVVLPYNETDGAKTTAIKQELCTGRDGENKVMWGYPWQIGGDGNMSSVDSGRVYWNGIGPSWHGILNSPLM